MTKYTLVILVTLFSQLFAQSFLTSTNNSFEENIFKNFLMSHNIKPDTLKPELDEYSFSQIIENDFCDSWNTGISLVKSPFNFSAENWLTTSAIAGGTILLFSIDKNVKDISRSNQTTTNDKIFIFDKYFGNEYTAYFAAGLYGYGLISGNSDIRRLGLKATQAFIFSGTIELILKTGLGRERPYMGNNQLFFKPFQLTNNNYQSLPSGHTTVAFAVATVMADYSDNFFWNFFWYGSASMVGLSRIYHNQHWASDVFLGAAIGYFTAKFILSSDSKSEGNNSSEISVTLSPVISNFGNGLRFNFRF